MPKDPPDRLATVIVLELRQLQTQPLITTPSEDGKIELQGRDVVVHGRMVRYEPDPRKNTVGYGPTRDWVSWTFEVTKPGTYGSTSFRAAAKGAAGARSNSPSDRGRC